MGHGFDHDFGSVKLSERVGCDCSILLSGISIPNLKFQYLFFSDFKFLPNEKPGGFGKF